MKVCSKCNLEKSTDEFYRDASRKDGLHSQCKLCWETKRKVYFEGYFLNSQDNPAKGKKECSKCEVKKPVKEFSKNRNTRDGLCHECKSCMMEYQKVYTQEETNKEKIRQYQKEYQKVYRKG